jgi:hypothetical protein
MAEDEAKRKLLPGIFGRYATPRQMKKTYWDDERVKHDPEDQTSKDWDNSEPDPEAP